MATVWIHRATACDILVRFQSLQKAYSYILDIVGSGEEEPDSIPEDGYDVAQTSTMQYSIHGLKFNARGWNPDGVVVVSPKEAVELGEEGIPVGFIPGETESPWYPERRSHAELDEELDTWTRQHRLEEAHTTALEYRSSFLDHEWDRIIDTEERYIDNGCYDDAIDMWATVIAEGRVRCM